MGLKRGFTAAVVTIAVTGAILALAAVIVWQLIRQAAELLGQLPGLLAGAALLALLGLGRLLGSLGCAVRSRGLRLLGRGRLDVVRDIAIGIEHILPPFWSRRRHYHSMLPKSARSQTPADVSVVLQLRGPFPPPVSRVAQKGSPPSVPMAGICAT